MSTNQGSDLRFCSTLDKRGMLRTLARLRGSALRGRALGRTIVILAVLMTYSFAAVEKIDSANAEIEQPFHIDNVKLYLYNKVDWSEFQCANDLAIRESNWRVKAVNKESGAYGIFQHMSKYAPTWDAYEQIDKHIEYIEHRYDGSWCKALAHSLRYSWH
jgi:hypothetical protein